MLTTNFLEPGRIKIQGSEIAFTLETDFDEDWSSQVYGLEFAKTPKGRRKQLLVLREELDEDGQFVSVSICMEHTKTCKERDKLLSFIATYATLKHETQEVLDCDFLDRVKSFYMSFE